MAENAPPGPNGGYGNERGERKCVDPITDRVNESRCEHPRVGVGQYEADPAVGRLSSAEELRYRRRHERQPGPQVGRSEAAGIRWPIRQRGWSRRRNTPSTSPARTA